MVDAGTELKGPRTAHVLVVAHRARQRHRPPAGEHRHDQRDVGQVDAAVFELKLRDAATAPIMPPNSDAAVVMIGLLTMGLDPAEAPSLAFDAPAAALAPAEAPGGA